MKPSACRFLLLTLMLLYMTASAHNDAVLTDSINGRQSVGLVLSGGGAKGIAHIGVIQALEENGIPIDYVTGTSMGAIVGGLYAAGYTPQQMLDLLQSRQFSYWSTGRIDETLVYHFFKPEPSPALASIPVSSKGSVTQTPASIISPHPMNFAFMELFAPYTARCHGDFDRLFVPFRCVASDIENKHKVVFSHGQLGDAIRASMSFPVVFQPIEIDSILMYDGGIYDNFPVDVMQSDFNPSVIIGVDVHSNTTPADDRTLVNQIEDMVIQNNDYNLPAHDGIKIRLDLNQFSLLDFNAARRIYDIGYNHTLSLIDSIKGRITARTDTTSLRLRRQAFGASTPPLQFESVSVRGGTTHENRYIRYLFTHGLSDTLDIESARRAFYHAITPGKLSNLYPTATYSDSSQCYDLTLKANVKNDLTVGVGGYLTSSSNSMIFLTGRYTSMSLNTMDANLDAWIGQSYMAAAVNTRFVLPSHIPTALSLQAVISRRKYYESDRFFFDNTTPTFVTTVEGFGRLLYTIAAGRNAKTSFGIGGGSIINRFYRHDAVNYDNADRDNTRTDIVQARWAFDSSTLNSLITPTTGFYSRLGVSYNIGRYHYSPGIAQFQSRNSDINWIQAEAHIKGYLRPHTHFSIGGELDALFSSRKLLDNYNATIVNAPAFTPTPNADNNFNPALRANSFMAIGIVPTWIINDNLQLRGNAHLFQPVKKIHLDPATGMARYGRPFSKRYTYCELSASYSLLNIATISIYGNYISYPARNWNAGITFGLYLLAPTLN